MARNIQSPARVIVVALAVMLALPVFAFANQGRGRGRGKPTEVFVNGHDARDGRWDKDGRRDRRGRRGDYRNDDYYRRRRDDGRYGRNDGRYGRNDGRYGRNDGYYGRNDGYNQQLRQVALNNGYNEGVEEGRKDADRGDRFDYSDEGDFRSGTKGYNSRYGNKDLYRQYFREGFARGYRDGYQQNGYYGRDDDDRYRRGTSVGDILGGIFGRP